MPTSSQAMILRSKYREFQNQQHSLFSVRSATQQNTDKTPGHVQHGFMFNAAYKYPMEGFEGVFEYDQKTHNYRWRTNIHNKAPGHELISQLRQEGRDELANNIADDLQNYIVNNTSGIDVDSGVLVAPCPSVSDGMANYDRVSQYGRCVVSPSGMYPLNHSSFQRLEEYDFRRRSINMHPSNEVSRSASLSSATKSYPLVRPHSQLSGTFDSVASIAGKLQATSLNNQSRFKLSPIPNDVPKRSRPATADLSSTRGIVGKEINYDERKSNSVGISKSSGRAAYGECIRSKVNSYRRTRVAPPKPKSLLDELKETVNWSGRVQMPAKCPKPLSGRIRHNTACFTLSDCSSLSHKEVKDLVESQISCQVKSIQFDPASLRLRDPDVHDRWLVTFETQAQYQQAIQQGLNIKDVVPLRSWEDIQREEKAYADGPQSYRQHQKRSLKKILKAGDPS